MWVIMQIFYQLRLKKCVQNIGKNISMTYVYFNFHIEQNAVKLLSEEKIFVSIIKTLLGFYLFNSNRLKRII